VKSIGVNSDFFFNAVITELEKTYECKHWCV